MLEYFDMRNQSCESKYYNVESCGIREFKTIDAHQGSVLSSLMFVLVSDFVVEYSRECLMYEMFVF